MKSHRVSVLAAVAFAVACGAASNPNVAATAGDQQLSVTRLAELLAQTPAPLEKDVARSIAEVWISYQLAGAAAAKGDSLADPETMRDALWSTLSNIRVRKFYENVSKGWDTLAPGPDEQRYANGEALAARHILVKTDEGATPEQLSAARNKALGILAQATPQNFVSLTAKSDEPGAKERGGDLGVFPRGAMVPEFEKCLLALKIGEVSKEPCQTSFGWHIIYRSSYADVKDKFAPIAKQRNVAIAESTYLAKLESTNEVKVESNVAVTAKAVAKNPLGYAKNTDAVATYKGGKLTAARLAEWISAYPPQSQLRPQLAQAPDTLVEKFVRQIVRNELVLRQADSAKAQVDTAEMSNLFLTFKNDVSRIWTQLGVDPAKLADSAKSGGDKAKIAAARVEAYFDKMIRNEAAFVEVPYSVSRALQKKLSYAINDAGLDNVIEKAKAVRATADSLKAKQAPTAAPTPGAAPGAPAPAAPAPAAPAPAPDAAKKK